MRPSKPKMDLMFNTLGLVIMYEPRVKPEQLRYAERRSWMLHRQLASHLDDETFAVWKPTLLGNIEWMRQANKGEPHLGNIDRWEALILAGDIEGLR